MRNLCKNDRNSPHFFFSCARLHRYFKVLFSLRCTLPHMRLPSIRSLRFTRPHVPLPSPNAVSFISHFLWTHAKILAQIWRLLFNGNFFLAILLLDVTCHVFPVPTLLYVPCYVFFFCAYLTLSTLHCFPCPLPTSLCLPCTVYLRLSTVHSSFRPS